MSKHKHQRRTEERPRKTEASGAAAPAAHPPTKNLTLLIISAVLFAVWFLFLAIMAFRA